MKKALGTLACLLIIPAAALAQAAVAGSVSDPSGAPLPGVAVVALSEALIENTRTTLTDGAGRYRIEDLRPGTYQVRFTLAGWRPYQLTGVEVTGSLTAIVDVLLSVGTLTETITVAVDPTAIDLPWRRWTPGCRAEAATSSRDSTTSSPPRRGRSTTS